ncbi:MAG TPA: response regulator transcription factor [Jiangellales bacterium]|nr:response regulator transcription factor [Jiangellales bacterium]
MRAVIAEDMVLLREGIARVLGRVGVDVVAEVGDARALVGAVVATRPDVAIVDVRMPPTFVDEGAQAVLLLRHRFPDLAVLVLSHVVEPRLAARLVADRPAAFGYLLKDRVLDLDDFLGALRRVVDGGTAIDPVVVARLMSSSDGRLSVLSPRELEVLERLAAGLSNAAIAEDLVVSERTVDAHVSSIFTKLGLPPTRDTNRRVQAALAWLQASDAAVPPTTG